MKNKNIFDMLENAEDELMDDFTDMSPEISDERLDKLLAVSERNYKMKKKEIERAKKDNNINYDADSVSGVERAKRPVWLAPLLTAASLVLVTGAVIGSIALLNRNGRSVGGNDDFSTATTSTVENTVISTTATGTAVTEESGTTVTTTVEETAVTEANTTEPNDVQQAGNISASDDLSRYVFEIYKRSEDISMALEGIGVQCGTDYIMFNIDPEAGYSCYDLEKKNGEWAQDRVFYLPVTDERFSSYDELRQYIRSAFSENCFVYTSFIGNGKTGLDDVEVGGYLDSSKIGSYIEYRGKLYMFAPSGGKGYVPPVYSDDYPVIIANKTDTSFTAYITEYYGGASDFPDLENCSCAQVSFILDPEYNDWRIDDITPRPAPYYKNMYDIYCN